LEDRGILDIVSDTKQLVENIVRDSGLRSEFRDCIESFLFNTVMFDIASKICCGRRISFNIDRYIPRIKRILYKREYLEYLEEMCRYYSEVLRDKPRLIVDMGCGIGLNLLVSKRLSKEKTLLIGIDTNECFLKIAEKIIPEAIFINADITDDLLLNNSVDLMYCTLVLHELPDLNVLSSFHRILRDNGKIIVLDITLDHVPASLLDIIRRIKIGLRLDPETPYNRRQLLLEVLSRGFKVLREHYMKKIGFICFTTLVLAKHIRKE